MAVDQAPGAFRAQRLEGADGRAGLALGAALEVLAEQHQRDHHGRCLEIQVRHLPGRRDPPLVQAQPVTGAGTEGDQQVHVAGSGAHGLPAGDIEACTEHELHRRGEQELQPGWEHPVLAEQVGEHRDHQRCGQQQRRDHRQTLALQSPFRRLWVGPLGARQCGLIARRADRLDQLLRVERGNAAHLRPLARQVDRGAQHTWHLEQGALDATDAAGAGHAAKAQLVVGLCDRVAGLVDGLDQLFERGGFRFDQGLLVGQVDVRCAHARYLAQGAFDAPGATGAGHADDRQGV